MKDYSIQAWHGDDNAFQDAPEPADSRIIPGLINFVSRYFFYRHNRQFNKINENSK